MNRSVISGSSYAHTILRVCSIILVGLLLWFTLELVPFTSWVVTMIPFVWIGVVSAKSFNSVSEIWFIGLFLLSSGYTSTVIYPNLFGATFSFCVFSVALICFVTTAELHRMSSNKLKQSS